MACSTCGFENPQGSATCVRCGTSLIPGSQNPFADRLPAAPGYPPSAPSYPSAPGYPNSPPPGFVPGQVPPVQPGQPYSPAPGYYVPGPAPGFPPPGSAGPEPHIDPGLKLLVPIGTSPTAIAAGYLGLFSLFCGLLGPIAIVVGIVGLRQGKKHPESAGTARCIVGIALGAVSTLILFAILIAVLVSNA